MHILIATDGHIDDQQAADLVARFHEPGDRVTIMTAINHPREFLTSAAEITGVEAIAKLAHEAGAGVLGVASGAKAAERMAASSHSHQKVPSIEGLFTSEARHRTEGLHEALTTRQIESNVIWRSTEYQTANAILGVVDSEDADLLLVGDHRIRRGRHGLGATATKLVRDCPIPVTIVKSPKLDS